MNQRQLLLSEERHAIFDSRREYRYRLKIVWRPDLPLINFIGLNPSIADESIDDNTVAKLKRYSKKWDFGGLIMSNLFAVVATDPDVMMAHPEPVGIENDSWLSLSSVHASTVVLCWGNDGDHMGRDAEVLKLITMNGTRKRKLHCFKVTKQKQPWHPLYLPENILLQEWAA